MKYTKSTWQYSAEDLADLDSLPFVQYSKFDENDQEVCRIEQYISGEMLYIDHSNQEGVDKSWLSGISFDEVMASDLDDELVSVQISQDDFDALWFRADNPKLIH